jgi:hypothetical protein
MKTARTLWSVSLALLIAWYARLAIVSSHEDFIAASTLALAAILWCNATLSLRQEKLTSAIISSVSAAILLVAGFIGVACSMGWCGR